MGKAPVPEPDYSNAGANRDRPRPAAPEPSSSIGRALQSAIDPATARDAIQAAAASHGHDAAEIAVDFEAIGEGPIADARCATLLDVISFLNQNLRL